jgi:microcin C transport system substrate-binding protein
MVMRRLLVAAASLAIVGGLVVAASAQDDGTPWMHGINTDGDPMKYAEGFPYFDYVNPDAPKGGLVRFAALGTFDTLNDAAPQGTPAGVGLIYDGLMTGTLDEPLAQYGLLAERLRHANDYSWATFKLREDAYWHDGVPITVEDVIWTFETLIELDPNTAQYYSHVESLEQTGDWEFTFYFDETGNRELPTIVGQLTVLPKHYWEGVDENGVQRDISQPTLTPPLGSSAYRVGTVEPGRSISFERVPDFWGANHPTFIGMNNFDELRVEYFLDETVMFEAFKADQYDMRSENIARRWANEYNFPAVQDGRVVLEWVETQIVSGQTVGYVWNTRRPQFQDARVRRALSLAYPFEDLNRDIFYGQYIRTRSHWDGIELAATGVPQGRELEILEGLRDLVPPEVFGEAYQAPVNDTPEQLRDNLRLALDLLQQAGWTLQGNTLVNAQGQPFVIEWLNVQPTLETQALRYQAELAKIGIDFQIRTVDSSQFVARRRAFDFDVIYTSFGQSSSPGNELYYFFGTEGAGQEGTPNYAGISNPAVDALIELITQAPNREEQIAATRALDRVLTYNYYFTFGYTLRAARIAYWDRFSHPDPLPPYSIGFPTIWWYDVEKAARTGPAP